MKIFKINEDLILLNRVVKNILLVILFSISKLNKLKIKRYDLKQSNCVSDKKLYDLDHMIIYICVYYIILYIYRCVY